MIDLVLPEQRLGFAGTLFQMHRDRKHVFVDRLGWKLRNSGSWLEVDEFDNDYAVYLLARSAGADRHLGSVRLLPTTKPHMLAGLFGHLCDGPLPAGEDCWEISRFVTSAGTAPGAAVLRIYRLFALALVEFARLNGIARYALVTEAHRVPALLSIGWKVLPLGLPAKLDGGEAQAFQIIIEEDTLDALRARFGFSAPVLRTGPPGGDPC